MKRFPLILGTVLLLASLTSPGGASAATPAVSPGDYVGTETCLECHDDVLYGETTHALAEVHQEQAAGCESCHGPGALHADEVDPELILGFSGEQTARETEVCLSCHQGQLAHWSGSYHESMDVNCTSCHAVHQSVTQDRLLVKQESTDLCLSCHQDHKKDLYARSGHPLRYGQMGCDDCHDPHGSMTEANISATTVNDKCWECHAETRGPFLWEHAPVREDCLTCHDAHSSNQTKMLTVSAPRLCQSCHLFGHHQTVPGMPEQVWNQNRSCLNCHPSIHGSNHPSGIVLMR